MNEDPQLANPLKRPVILALYKAIKDLYPEVHLEYEEHYDRELANEKVRDID